jgi:predicted phage tail protein
VDGYFVYADGQQVGSVGSAISNYQVTNLGCNTSHSFYVTAVRQGVQSNPGNTAGATTPSCAPLVISPAAGALLDDRRPNFNWQSVQDATSYTLQVSPYANFSSLTLNTTLPGTSYLVVSDLAANTVFYWRVRANGPFGQSDWSAGISFRTANPPGVPIQLIPAVNGLVSDYTPRLDWQDATVPAGTALDHYQVQLSPDLAFTTLLYDEPAGLSEFTLPVDLLPNSKYYWQVRAYNTLGQASAWSSKRALRTAMLPPVLSAPLTGTAMPSLRPALDWGDVDGASGYLLQISKYSNFSSLLRSVSQPGSAYTPTTDLPANSVLYWRVQATGLNGPSLWSPTWDFITANPPSVAALLAPGNGALVTDYTPRLDWSTVVVPAGTTFDHFQLQLSTDAAFSSILLDQTVASLTGSEFAPASDLPANARYYWHVRAFNTAGQFSSWSAGWYFRTAILPPSLLSPAAGESLLNRRPPLDWEDAAGASGYRVQISRYTNFSLLLLNAFSVPSQFNPPADLPASTTVYWRVQATGSNGPSLWSGVSSFTTANPPGIPAPVSPVSGSLSTDYTPRLDWSTVSVPVGTTFDHYQLQLAPDLAFTSPIVTEDIPGISSSEFTLASDLVPNTKFYWRVRTFNAAGQYSSWSAVWSFRTALAPPTLLAPEDAGTLIELRPLFDWAESAGSSSYTIQVSLYPNFSAYLVSTTTSATSYLSGLNLPRARALYWRVRANGTNGPSLWSAVHSFLIQ